jgi:hypothetical protein
MDNRHPALLETTITVLLHHRNHPIETNHHSTEIGIATLTWNIGRK